ncbi:MAG: U32 family peptidase [Ruminococcus sp.]|nr:U32 family peptidase [Ruminococcus sp.]
MKRIEILAPCGGFESVVAAVRSGADAVYLGAKEFSARAGAENFGFEELRTAVEYCHIRGALVYLTVNTVVFDSELEGIYGLIKEAAKADVDALITQNMAVAKLAQKIAPELSLHASTQMSVHSPSGAKLLYEEGFKRVVLSRELSREEIREIALACPEIELEVFVHGALCMSVSGQCYFSAVLGSRSGNRGRCAQTCRLPFSVGGKGNYALSLKDQSIIDYLRELEEIGVTSAKIEGRLKRPEYVSAAVKACVQSRDEGFVDEATRSRLMSVFSRTGFTDGYYTSRRGYEMFGYRKKEDVVSATEKLLSEIRSSYRNELPRVAVRAKLKALTGEKPTLNVTDGANTVEITLDAECERALNKPLDREKAEKQLKKTGSTPYYMESVDITLSEDVSMPLSSINELRRLALEALGEKRKITHNYKINEIKLPRFKPHRAKTKKRYARFTSTKIGAGFKSLDLCFVPVTSSVDEVDMLIENGFTVGVEIPRALFSREKRVIEALEGFREIGVTDVLCNNLAAVYIARSLGLRIHGGFGLNFTNTVDLEWAREYGFEDTELSFELKNQQISALGSELPRGIISWGFLPVMLCRNCPNKSENISCRDCRGRGKMKDRLSKTFIFYCDGTACEVLNTLPVENLGFAGESRSVDFEVFRFSVENSVENVENISDFISHSLNLSEKTHGLYLRGIK